MTQDELDRRAAQAADDRIAAEDGWALLREMDARRDAELAAMDAGDANEDDYEYPWER